MPVPDFCQKVFGCICFSVLLVVVSMALNGTFESKKKERAGHGWGDTPAPPAQARIAGQCFLEKSKLGACTGDTRRVRPHYPAVKGDVVDFRPSIRPSPGKFDLKFPAGLSGPFALVLSRFGSIANLPPLPIAHHHCDNPRIARCSHMQTPEDHN